MDPVLITMGLIIQPNNYLSRYSYDKFLIYFYLTHHLMMSGINIKPCYLLFHISVCLKASETEYTERHVREA